MSKRIILVDDDEAVRPVLAEILEYVAPGVVVVAVATVADAMSALAESFTGTTSLFTDWNLGVNQCGDALIAAARAQGLYPHGRAVLISGQKADGFEEAAGVDVRVLAKPVRMVDVGAAVTWLFDGV